MSHFGQLIDAARRGTMGRRGFLAAALALGVGTEEALAEKRRVVVAVPGDRVRGLLQYWQPQLRSWGHLRIDVPGNRAVVDLGGAIVDRVPFVSIFAGHYDDPHAYMVTHRGQRATIHKLGPA